MANIKMTCENKFKTCKEPKKEAVLKDEKGNPQFQMIICTTCYGVVDSYKIIPPKEDKKPKEKAKVEAPAVEKTELVELPPVEAKKVEETVEPEVQEPVKKSEPEPQVVEQEIAQRPEPDFGTDEGSFIGKPTEEKADSVDVYVTMLELKETTVVDIIMKLKEHFGLSNTEAAKVLKDRKAKSKVPAEEQVAKEVVAEVVQKAAEVVHKAKTIPAPLPEKEAKQAAESPIKPGNVTSVAQKEELFPVTGFDLDFEHKAYNFKLATVDGEEFEFSVVPHPAKFEIVTKNPSVFNDKSLMIQYDKIGSNGMPVEGKLIGMK